MRALVLRSSPGALVLEEVPCPVAACGELLLRVEACGLCRTDLHILDAELAKPALPLIPGHQIVGRVEAFGPGLEGFEVGERVGVPWLGGACGSCQYCLEHRENLCDEPCFTGFHRNGGFAEYAAADARFCFPIPDGYSSVAAAPLLCAGLIGFRTLRLAGDPHRVGIYGFGSAAHLVAQLALHQGREVYAFTRRGDRASQEFARRLGVAWAGSSDEPPPQPLDAALLFAPIGDLVPQALRAVRKGGAVVCGGIHMSDIPAFPYELLWGERVLRSVANLTRQDGREFFALAAQLKFQVETARYRLSEVEAALAALRQGRLQGAAVLVPDGQEEGSS